MQNRTVSQRNVELVRASFEAFGRGDVATILEVRAADGIGVLARITDAIAGRQVRVEQAYVSTLGHEVVDTFYVTSPDGAKLTDPDILADLEHALLGSLRPATCGTSDSSHVDDQLR